MVQKARTVYLKCISSKIIALKRLDNHNCLYYQKKLRIKGGLFFHAPLRWISMKTCKNVADHRRIDFSSSRRKNKWYKERHTLSCTRP